MDTGTPYDSATRKRLMGIAYRILGSRADAEDAVQDTLMKWQAVDPKTIANPGAYLTTLVTRRSIDLLRSAHRSRTTYVGAWLPEPIAGAVDETDEDIALAGTLTTAFLLLLERLTPRERAAYLLHDVFDMSHRDVAETLDISQAACRQLVSRARARVGRKDHRYDTPGDVQNRLVNAFKTAVETGQTDHLAGLLRDDAILVADSGGKVPAIGRVLTGTDDVLAFISGPLGRFWNKAEWAILPHGGGLGLAVRREDRVATVVTFGFDNDGMLEAVFILRNPEKLGRLDAFEGRWTEVKTVRH